VIPLSKYFEKKVDMFITPLSFEREEAKILQYGQTDDET